MLMMPEVRPKLRPIDVRPIQQNGQSLLLLVDPLHLSDEMIAIPAQWGPLLLLCDGSRDLRALQASLLVRFGLRAGLTDLAQIVSVFDQALLLDNRRAMEALTQTLERYRQATHRPSALAGRSYPADGDALRAMLRRYVDESVHADVPQSNARGIVSPHIDYQRGGPVYAAVWARVRQAVRRAELVIVLGTDHMGAETPLTLTRQHYATPWGVLPTDRDVVDALAEAVGEATAFRDELHHRSEHSVELATVWLHYIRGTDVPPCRLVPVLCGSFAHFVEDDADPATDEIIRQTVAVLKPLVDEGRALVVAAADLAHVGPAFGGQPVGVMERAHLKAADDALLAHICAGNATGFFDAIRRVGDRNNVCGLPPIYLLLRLLPDAQGEVVAYDRCPADADGTSLVSICGVILS